MTLRYAIALSLARFCVENKFISNNEKALKGRRAYEHRSASLWNIPSWGLLPSYSFSLLTLPKESEALRPLIARYRGPVQGDRAGNSIRRGWMQFRFPMRHSLWDSLAKCSSALAMKMKPRELCSQKVVECAMYVFTHVFDCIA